MFAANVMSADVVKSTVPTSAVAAMLVNLQGDTHNILVVDEAGKLIGIISARDIICRLPTMMRQAFRINQTGV